jgi:hypothetical protein
MWKCSLHLLGIILSISVFAGCGGGGPPPVDNPPAVSGASVAPAELRYTGGQVSITATVTDDRGVGSVVAAVTGPGGTPATVAMSLTSGRYEGAYDAAGNATIADQAYTVRVTANDNAGQSASSAALSFKVKSAYAPPPEGPW